MSKIIYTCTVCGNNTHRWTGKCNTCGTWDSIISKSLQKIKTEETDTVVLSLFDSKISSLSKYNTKIDELDRVFGGGITLGSNILIGGEPGVGKSTLILQIASILAKNFHSCLYASGEESINQIQTRATRLCISESKIKILATSSLKLSHIINAMQKDNELKFLIIDSIQTICDERIPSAPGTIAQVRMCTHELITFTKQNNITLFILGQITKDGQIAGPKTLEHMVDTVLYFEGDNSYQYRILRTIKNRFGPTNEIGVFEMLKHGLIPVNNPSSLFLGHKAQDHSIIGSTVFAGIEGSRPILMEIQSLISHTYMATPRRAVVGCDINRLSMIIAVLNAKCNIFLGDKEVYLNIAGGLKIYEPAADLAIAASLISNFTNIPIMHSTIVCGEIALSGEIRNICNIDLRLKEAYKLGFKQAIIPRNSKCISPDISIIEVDHINQLRKIFH
ncbi:DNA repair protein RadA [Candidatus Neoehrlichia procyonis]|uniref:DNA repair protein RadA n=1 Tax=Candidatus Neoehrlichia procyonis str. RAC413 TaxID=1359163 RepID=A0A0F3NMA5_9RICK|nr:DNA repair protein RadA [Candidatus Neoehrlichia lotoris]KJV69160.1 DNA repair protein RadA [Candidatus Neoehrlichia lotoris str. RAC413]